MNDAAILSVKTISEPKATKLKSRLGVQARIVRILRLPKGNVVPPNLIVIEADAWANCTTSLPPAHQSIVAGYLRRRGRFVVLEALLLRPFELQPSAFPPDIVIDAPKIPIIKP